jgi:hypothetical protein
MVLWTAFSALAADPSMRLIMHDSRVDVYSRGACRAGDGGGGGPDVLFVIENRTAEKIRLSMDLASRNAVNKLTLTLEPMGSTSVLSMDPDVDPCRIELVGMRIGSSAG